MKIVIVGAGYVGLVSGVCFSDFGHDVVCVEKDERKLDMLGRGEIPIYEPGRIGVKTRTSAPSVRPRVMESITV